MIEKTLKGRYMVDFRELVQHGIHFGHQTSRWCPKMAPYIWGHRNGIHLIDVTKTARAMENAAAFLEQITSEGKTVLFVGTKKSAQGAIEKAGKELNVPYVTYRWIGGTLTNFSQVKKAVTKLLHHEDILAKSENYPYTKKELTVFNKMVERLDRSIGGIRSLTWPVGAVVLVDVKKEDTALREANIAGIPVVALVDTNNDPSLVNYVIPANDDSPRAVAFVVDYLAQSVARGKAKAEETQKKQQSEAAAKRTDVEKDRAERPASRGFERAPLHAQRRPMVKKVVKPVVASSKTEEKAQEAPKAENVQE
jgi:small subunit ribosomal protein S2